MVQTIQLFLVVTLFQARPTSRIPCRPVTETATLLRDVVAANWTTISKEDMLRRWPGLELSLSVPEWPADLIGNAENLYCKESFSIRQQGGIQGMSVFYSGTRDQVVAAAYELIKNLNGNAADWGVRLTAITFPSVR